jgi:hypothetical protein
MQPSNLSLDPAANLWTTNPLNSNPFAQPTTSPEATEGTFNTGSLQNFYTPSIGNAMGGPVDAIKSQSQHMPDLSATSTTGSNDNSAGEVFMGAGTPQPGGWKWTNTVLNDRK